MIRPLAARKQRIPVQQFYARGNKTAGGKETQKAPGIAPWGLAHRAGLHLALVAIELLVALLGFDAVLGGRAD